MHAREALALGLLDVVATEGETLEQAVARFLEPILRQTPLVIRAYKAMAAAERQGLSAAERRAIEREWFSQTWTHADHWSAVNVFMQKRRTRTK